MLGEIIYNFCGYYEDYETVENFLTKSFWNLLYVKFSIMYGITIVILLPLCLLRDVSRLGVSSLLGLITFIFIIIILIIQSPSYIKHYWKNIYEENDPSTHLNIFNISSGFDINLFFFQGTATFFFFYSCHTGSFPILKSLKDKTEKRIQKVIVRGLLINTTMFSIIAIFGYLTCPIDTPALIIERNNIQGGSDIAMSLCKLSLVIILIMKLPILYNIYKLSYFQLVKGDSEITNLR
jgi:amino acid permease